MRGLIFLLLLCSCHSPEYYDSYRHVKRPKRECFYPSPCFLILAVDARHLDYTHCASFLQSVAKHPSDGSKNSDFGHAWIYLKKGEALLEGGHSAERGYLQPRYIDGVCLLAEKGDPNPVRYLWSEQQDGYFEGGRGGHRATFAAKIDLTEEQYEKILAYIESYRFDHYAITGQSCATFVAGVARVIGVELEVQQTLLLPPRVFDLPLWSDPAYSQILLASPDRLEKSLMEKVKEGALQPATYWLNRQREESFIPRCQRTWDDLRRLPARTWRYFQCL